MGDDRFDRAVILVCAHDEKGAMGLILNSELPNINFSDLIEQLDLDAKSTGESTNGTSNEKNSSPEIYAAPSLPVMKGGPVEEARGFLLHSSDFRQSDTINVDEKYALSGSVDALRKIVTGTKPEKMLFLLGYSGWGPGQLDREIQMNTWLTLEPDPDLVFDTNSADMWRKAIEKLGIDVAKLSSFSGRA